MKSETCTSIDHQSTAHTSSCSSAVDACCCHLLLRRLRPQQHHQQREEEGERQAGQPQGLWPAHRRRRRTGWLHVFPPPCRRAYGSIDGIRTHSSRTISNPNTFWRRCDEDRSGCRWTAPPVEIVPCVHEIYDGLWIDRFKALARLVCVGFGLGGINFESVTDDSESRSLPVLIRRKRAPRGIGMRCPRS